MFVPHTSLVNQTTKPVILAIQNDPTDPPHLAGKWLEEIGFDVRVLRADQGEVVPDSVPDNVAGIMPLGGHMGAMDDHIAPWLIHERALLKDAVERNVPIFGICLGAQLLAAANGGEVRRAETSEIGVYDITPLESATTDPVFNLPITKAAQWHEDIVTRLPVGATRLASSPLCENQVYRIGDAQYAVQFHPEIDRSIIRDWEEHADNAFLESGKSSVEAEVAAADEEMQATWKPVIQNWGKLVLGSL